MDSSRHNFYDHHKDSTLQFYDKKPLLLESEDQMYGQRDRLTKNRKFDHQLHVKYLDEVLLERDLENKLDIHKNNDSESKCDKKPRKSSLCYSSVALPAPQLFTDKQKQRLRQSWDHLGKRGPSGIGCMIFRRVFTRCPAVRRMFGFGETPDDRLIYDPSFVKHARVFVAVIDGAVQHLDDLDREYAPLLIKYGERHLPLRSHGFRPEFWDVFAECMTESAMEWVAPGRYKDAVRPWALLMSFIVDKMRQGYTEAMKRQARKNSLDALTGRLPSPNRRPRSQTSLPGPDASLAACPLMVDKSPTVHTHLTNTVVGPAVEKKIGFCRSWCLAAGIGKKKASNYDEQVYKDWTENYEAY
uniref:Globin family profile domain-containing protein n=1 Tax=Romanomermis culicivorax TaxID=13658 RepID=A0A915I9D2_ROMCU